MLKHGMMTVLLLAGLWGCGGTPTATAPAEPWLAYGDSITKAAFAQPTVWPNVTGVGMPGATSAEAVAPLSGVLGAHPEARRVALGFGTNDVVLGNTPEAFTRMMRAMVERVRQAGKQPRIARIPYGSHPKLATVPAFNAALAGLEAELGLTPGPDLYTWFKNHPEELQADGIHPNQAGCLSIQRLWAESAGR